MEPSTGPAAERFDSLVHITASGHWINGRDDASLTRLIAELDRAHVSRACLVGLPGVTDNETVHTAAARTAGRLVPIAGVNPIDYPDTETLRGEMRDLAGRGFRGIKLHPRLNEYHPLHPRVVRVINEAADAGFVVFIDTLFRQSKRSTLAAADTIDRLVHRCPRATMVLLHGGGPDLLRVAEIVRLHSQLLLDLSFTLLAYAGSSVMHDIPWLFHRLDRRIVIGSDMPEFTPAEAFAAAEGFAKGLPPDKWRNISGGNLQRLFGSHG